MNLPRSITINGKRWSVRLGALRARGLYGTCNYRRRVITIDREASAEERAETFLHELLHACLPERWSVRAEERMVRRLAPRLLSALRQLRRPL